MSHFQILIATLGSAAGLLALVLGLVMRITRKWTRIEDQLGELTKDIRHIVEEKSEAHEQLFQAIRTLDATLNERVTYLERNLWRKRRGSSS